MPSLWPGSATGVQFSTSPWPRTAMASFTVATPWGWPVRSRAWSVALTTLHTSSPPTSCATAQRVRWSPSRQVLPASVPLFPLFFPISTLKSQCHSNNALMIKSFPSFILCHDLNSPFASSQLPARQIRLLPPWTVQPTKLWFRGVVSPEWTPSLPPLWMKNKDFSAAAPLIPTAAYPTWNVASCTLSLSVTMMACAPACLLCPSIWSLVRTHWNMCFSPFMSLYLY